MSVLITTSVGEIVVDLYTDRCPLTTKNFLKLCKIKYYNGCLFHNVEKDYVAQTGDPTGTGTGGDSIYKFLFGDQARFFEDEIHPDLRHSKVGTLAMASGGKNCNASQFFLTLRGDLDYLDDKHTVFGIVAEEEGLETLKKINEAHVDGKGRPLKNIRIKHTYILDDPFDDPPQLAELIPGSSPEGKPRDEIAEERLEDNWVPLDETLGPEQLEEIIREKEAKTNAVILVTIGDIPDEDIAPPDNVLFVCKLNPVTQDEDLFTIFSRFGPVTSAEIIRDYKSGDSLGYAFIEFEKKEHCERAFFKMDNCLIDDRRIHVDFSQSVAKQWAQYRHGKRNKDKSGDDGPDSKPKISRYILKDDNIQHGGTDNRRYDMVFDDGNEGVDRHDREKGHRAKVQKTEQQKPVHSTDADRRNGSDRSYSRDIANKHGKEDDRSRNDRRYEDGQRYKDRKYHKHPDSRTRDDDRDHRSDRNRRDKSDRKRSGYDEGDRRKSSYDEGDRRKSSCEHDPRHRRESRHSDDRFQEEKRQGRRDDRK